MKATWELNHAKYRNLVRRLIVLIRQERMELVRISLQGSAMKVDSSDESKDHDLADMLSRASYASLVARDDRGDTWGQFTIDRDKPPHEAIADYTHEPKYQRIAQRVAYEFRPSSLSR